MGDAYFRRSFDNFRLFFASEVAIKEVKGCALDCSVRLVDVTVVSTGVRVSTV